MLRQDGDTDASPLRFETKMGVSMKQIAFASLTAICVVWALTDGAHAQASGRSATVCDRYARSYANDASRQGQVLRGAGVGSLVGLGLGSIGGAAGVGAAIGGTIGAIGGGARRADTSRKMYEAAYIDCMAGR